MFEINIKNWAIPFAFEAEKDWVVSFPPHPPALRAPSPPGARGLTPLLPLGEGWGGEGHPPHFSGLAY